MRTLLMAGVITTLSACAMQPVLDAYSTNGLSIDTTTQATIWSDNSNMLFAMITKVDGKGMPSRKGAGYPYSVAVTPGTHKLILLVADLSDFNPFLGDKSARLEKQINVEAGHAYKVSFQESSDGKSVGASIIDLGPRIACHYEVTASEHQGYVPVALRCSQQ